MLVGELRHYVNVTYESKTGVGERGNSSKQTVTLYSLVPASITKLAGRELELARQLKSDASYRVVMRYQPNITNGMKIVWEHLTLSIGDITIPEERNRWLVMLCSEVN